MAESNQHKYLKKIATIKIARMGFWVAYPEVYAGENCGNLDVAGAKQNGLSGIETIGIEVKVSREDYYSRKQKLLAIRSEKIAKENELGANFRYFMTPPGMIRTKPNLLGPSELYPGWGLMEFDGKKVKIVIPAEKFNVDNENILYWMARHPIYHYHQKITKIMAGYSYLNYSDIEF